MLKWLCHHQGNMCLQVIPGVQVKRLFWNPIHLRANHGSYTVSGPEFPYALAYLWALWKNIRKQVGCHRWRRVPHWFAGQAAGFTAFRFRFNHIFLISMICIDMQHMVSCWPWPELAPGHSPIRLVTFGFTGYILTDWGVQLTMCACYYSPETDKTIFATEWRCIVRKDLDVFAEWADSLVLCSVDSDVLLQLGGSSHLVTRVIHPIYNWVIRCYKML